MRSQQWRPSARLRKRRVPHLSIIDVSGLAAIMVFLLALFMVTADTYSGYHHYHGYHQNYGYVSSTQSTLQPGALKDDALIVDVHPDDNIYFASERVTPEQIPELIRAAVQQGSEPKVYLGIDARAIYGSVKVLLDQIRIARIENVVLLTN